MIGQLNHVAIAVPDLAAAAATYRGTLGAEVSAPEDLPDHGVTVVFVELPNTKIELLHPLGDNSPIAAFLDKNPSGGMHHICMRSMIFAPPAIIWRPRARACWAAVSRPSAPTASRCCSFIPRISSALWSNLSRRDAVDWVSGLVVYILLWWWVFFMALPVAIGRRRMSATAMRPARRPNRGC